MASALESAPNRVYYFELGCGSWRGRFTFRVTSWRGFWHERIGPRNRFLVLCLAVFTRAFGRSAIDSVMSIEPEAGRFGVARNRLRIDRLGIALYLAQEEYVLDPDGTSVEVTASERFGPIPFLFREKKRFTAVIHEGGHDSTYSMPLLGAAWTARYHIADDGGHIDGRIEGSWAEARESMDKHS
jgi:hypothetical protein